MNEIQALREEIERYFDPQSKVTEEHDLSRSPNGRYTLTVDVYRQRDATRNWSICEAVIADSVMGEEIVRLRCEDDRFCHCWIERNGAEYLVCSEALGGQTVIDLCARSVASYYTPEDPFIWIEFHPSPDRQRLAIVGCYWACPYAVTVYDFTRPMNLPLSPLIHVTLGGHEEFAEWITDTEFCLEDVAGNCRSIVLVSWQRWSHNPCAGPLSSGIRTGTESHSYGTQGLVV